MDTLFWFKVADLVIWILAVISLTHEYPDLIFSRKIMAIEIAAAPLIGLSSTRWMSFKQREKTFRWRLNITRIGLILTFILLLV